MKINGQRVEDIGYDKERGTIDFELHTGTKHISLKEQLTSMLDTICGIRRIALATQGCRLTAIYSMDGQGGYDRATGNYWYREEEHGIIWKCENNGDKAIQLMV